MVLYLGSMMFTQVSTIIEVLIDGDLHVGQLILLVIVELEELDVFSDLDTVKSRYKKPPI